MSDEDLKEFKTLITEAKRIKEVKGLVEDSTIHPVDKGNVIRELETVFNDKVIEVCNYIGMNLKKR